MTRKKDIAGRFQLILIALVFFGPLILADWLYFGGDGLGPAGRTNHGRLLEPMINIGEMLNNAAITESTDNRWLLIYVNDGTCDEACEFALYTLRQSRLMLGREMDRLVRVFLHGSIAPDTVLLAGEHEGLIALQDSAISNLISKKRPADLRPGGYYLVDPLGNLVMYFHADMEPDDMVEDIEHLLKLSRIG